MELAGLRRALSRQTGDELEVVIPLGRGDDTLGPVVDRQSLALSCTPAINLFSRRADRIHVTDQQAEHHVVIDRMRPMDFEVHSVERVVGYGDGVEAAREFQPFYASVDEGGREPASSYFTIRREPRALSEGQRRDGARSSYIGSELFLSLVDPQEEPYS